MKAAHSNGKKMKANVVGYILKATTGCQVDIGRYVIRVPLKDCRGLQG